jgi:AraC-like DNA-binding protein
MDEALKDAVRRYANQHSNADGLALPPVPGLRMMCVDTPRGKLQSTYRPLVCLILQGAKHLLVGRQERLCREGESVIVGTDMPVVGQVVQATPERPYIALAVELDMALLAELADDADGLPAGTLSHAQTLFVQDTDEAVLECGIRLMRLIGRPEAVPVLHPGLMRELHFWLLSGPHGPQLRAIAAPDGSTSRLGRAIALLRREFRDKLPVERLAEAAAMSLTAFHKHFKDITSLTPGQYQKRLRLIEARRLMLYEGRSASAAAFEVGYESVSQFTREYGRMFGAPPKRDSRSAARVRGLFARDGLPASG